MFKGKIHFLCDFSFLSVDNCVIFLTVFHILDDDIAVLKCILAKSHFEQLNILDLLFDVVGLGAHEFFSKHVLILSNESLLRTIQVD